MMKPDRQLAEKLLNISAIKLQPDMPFVWGSGWNSTVLIRTFVPYLDESLHLHRILRKVVR